MEPGLQVEDLEEISSRVALRFIRKVRAAAVHEEHAIATVENYVVTLTYNAIYDFRRHRYPERHRLKRNLRYILTRDSSFALWETRDGFVAGPASWKGQTPRAGTGSLSPSSATAVMCDREHPAEALRAVLQAVGHPIVFDTLVDLIANLWNVRDVVLESEEYPPDQQPDPLVSLEQREYLEATWCEIQALPEKQRSALLLNLRDAAGSNALVLFLLLNIATVAELAGAVGVTEEELTALWEALPLDDLTLAQRLGLTRQQVINLRKSARLRLARRLSKWK